MLILSINVNLEIEYNEIFFRCAITYKICTYFVYDFFSFPKICLIIALIVIDCAYICVYIYAIYIFLLCKNSFKLL